MKLVALLSGGKDSCYNLMHCVRNGHAVIAAASLRPNIGKEELDSFMYQTVGQDAIEYVAKALAVPLYRHVINGFALEQGSEYGSRLIPSQVAPSSSASHTGVEGDETEDMFELLKIVKDNHPEIEGVSVGAILSNYQRIRVEHVCRRLGLTSLSYLWQRNQRELLSEMIEAGLEAVIIKVAGLGLYPKHLGRTLAQMQPELERLCMLYGSHICGEGGEYETLTLECPIFHRRISLRQVETVMHSTSDIAPVAYLRILGADLIENDSHSTSFVVGIPPMLDELGVAVKVSAENLSQTAILTPLKLQSPPLPSPHFPTCAMNSAFSDSRKWVSLSNVQGSTTELLSIEEECAQCWDLVSDMLSRHSLNLSHISHVNVYLGTMEHFPYINMAMYQLFGTSPPTRACVAINLPSPARVRLDVIACSGLQPGDRRALHVQSMSYWAPANIGPYSQCVSIGQRLFISGQIGLIPSSMTMPSPKSLPLEVALSLQHVRRIARCMSEMIDQKGAGKEIAQSAIFWLEARECAAQDVQIVAAAWNKHSNSGIKLTAVIIGVKELPRSATVEAQVLYHCNRETGSDGATWDTLPERCGEGRRRELISRSLQEGGSELYFEVSPSGDDHTCALVAVRGTLDNAFGSDQDFNSYLNPIHLRAFYTPSVSEQHLRDIQQKIFGTQSNFTPIPVQFLVTSDMKEWDIVFILIHT